MQIIALRVGQTGTGRVVQSVHLTDPGFRAMAWGRKLYVFGRSTLQVFDISDPFEPRSLGVFHSEREILNGLVVGCMAFLVHDGPSLTVVDVASKNGPRPTGWYAGWPGLESILPTQGRVVIHRKHVFSFGVGGKGIVVGRLAALSLCAPEYAPREGFTLARTVGRVA